MPETDYLKIPQNRVGALIGSNGNVKKSIEKATGTILDIDSDEGTVYITPRDDMEDPLGVWNANHIVKAVARGFNPEVALKLVSDDIYLEVISLPKWLKWTWQYMEKQFHSSVKWTTSWLQRKPLK